MRLFWKTYLFVGLMILVSMALLTAFASIRAARTARRDLYNLHHVLAVSAGAELEHLLPEHENLPVRLLDRLAQSDNFCLLTVRDANGVEKKSHRSGDPTCDLHNHEWPEVSEAPMLVRCDERGGAAWIVPIWVTPGQPPWSLVLGFHSHNLKSQVWGVVRAHAIFAFALLVAITPVAILAARRMMSPLRNLAKVAMTVADEDESYPIGSMYDMGAIFESFSKKVDKLKARDARAREKIRSLQVARDELESAVDKRTADLAKANEKLTSQIKVRRQAESVLRQSEERYRRLLGSVTDYICSVDVKNEQAVSTVHGPGCLAVTGYASWEYEAQDYLWYRMVHEDDREAVRKHAEAICKGESVGPLEHRIIHKDGSIRWISNTPVIKRNDAGKVISYDALIADITARKQAEEQLRNSENRLRTVLDNVQSGILMIDAKTHVINYANKWALRMIGLTNDQVVGSVCHKYICLQNEGQCPMDNATGPMDACEKVLVRGDGSHCDVIKSVVPLTVKGCAYYLESILDISDRKRLEDELRQSKEQLEQRVVERTRELLEANEQIRQAQADLVQAEKMSLLGELVAGIAHEINTPTGAIMNVTGDSIQRLREFACVATGVGSLGADVGEWIQDAIMKTLEGGRIEDESAIREQRRAVEKQLRERGVSNAREISDLAVACRLDLDDMSIKCLNDPSVRAFLENLLALKASSDISHASVRKIARIVKALRYYSRSGEGDMFDIDINESIDNTLVILQNRIKHIARVERNYHEPLPKVRLGPDISQVWTNILSNACDAIEESPRQDDSVLRVSTSVDDNGVSVEIFNDGPSISDDTLQKIFDPFFTTKGIGKGMGLGLSICRGILHKYGGAITSSNVPDGVAFSITLPVSCAGDSSRAADIHAGMDKA